MIQLDLDFFEKIVFQQVLKKDNIYLASCVEYLEKGIFKNKDISEIIGVIKDFYLENDTIPTHTELKARVNTPELKNHLEKAIKQIRDLDTEYNDEELIRNTEEFLKQRKMDWFLEQTIDEKTEKKSIDMDKAYTETEKIHNISLIDNMGLDYFGENEKVVAYLQETDNFISSGYTGLDTAIGGGLHKEGRAIYGIGGETNVGKAQPCSLNFLTPDGNKRFGDLVVGDRVFGKNGTPIKITHIHPQGIKKIYEVKFMDGRKTYCCAEHLWTVWNSHKMRYDTLSTEVIKYKIENFKAYQKRLQVPLCEPVEFGSNHNLVIPPYEIAGVSTTKRVDEECLSKFIPDEYMCSSVDDRLHLIAGFLDTNGYITKSSSIEILLNNEDMINQLAFIVRSLGGNAIVSDTYKWYKGEHHRYHKIRIRFSYKLKSRLSLISRKYNRLLKFGENKKQYIHNSIVSITEYSNEEAMCITVDAPDALYLTNDFIVTHNSLLVGNIVTNVIRQQRDVVLITLEMSEKRYSKRISGMLTGLAIDSLKDQIEDYQEYIKNFVAENNARLIIKEFAAKTVSVKNIYAFIKKLERKKNFRPALIALDYHTLLKASTKQVDSKHGEIQLITQEARGLSYIFECPLITPMQLNRSSHKAHSPGLDSISGSWDSASDFDSIITLSQTDEDREANDIQYAGKKVRDGAKGNSGKLKIDYSTLRFYEENTDPVAIQQMNEISSVINFNELYE